MIAREVSLTNFKEKNKVADSNKTHNGTPRKMTSRKTVISAV